MCLAIPVKVEALQHGQTATVSLSGVKTDISIALIDDVKVGDYLIVHVGYALSKLDPEEAARTLELIRSGNEVDTDSVYHSGGEEH